MSDYEAAAANCGELEENEADSDGSKTPEPVQTEEEGAGASISTDTQQEEDGDAEAGTSAEGTEKPKIQSGFTDHLAGLPDDVLKKLGKINGEINSMSNVKLRDTLVSVNLSKSGVREVLKKRLKSYRHHRELEKIGLDYDETEVDYIIVMDFESTCLDEVDEDDIEIKFTHEIIEFPAVLIDARRPEIVAMFSEFVKPELNPVLTEDCKKITEIKQTEVDEAEKFPAVIEKFEKWIAEWELGTKHSFTVATDGLMEMYFYMVHQCKLSNIAVPWWCFHWLNVAQTFETVYGLERFSLANMLRHLGLHYKGKPNCVLDNAFNVARVVCQMVEDRCPLMKNETLTPDDPPLPQPTDCSNRFKIRRHHAFLKSKYPKGGRRLKDDKIYFAKICPLGPGGAILTVPTPPPASPAMPQAPPDNSNTFIPCSTPKTTLDILAAKAQAARPADAGKKNKKRGDKQ